MGLFIGIDGGGTKTKCVVVDDKLNIVSEASDSATNPYVVGLDESAKKLFGLITSVSSGKYIDSVLIGVAGGGRKNNNYELKCAIIDLARLENVSLKNIEIVSDAEIAIAGAFSGKTGAILIAGTGSIIFGKDRSGKFFRIGGYGKILGDEGSGFSIGRKGLSVAAKEFDGMGKKTILSEILCSKFGIINRDDLISKVYNEKFDIAGVAPYVIEAANKNDLVCKNILQDEIKELIYYIKAFKKKMVGNKIKLCLGGGLLSSKNYYSIELKRKIKKYFNDIKLTSADYPPEIGAALIAIENSKILKN